jgi:hypothetical protein
MAEILQFRPRLTVFAPELTLAMGDAYDKAIAALPNSDSGFMVRELLAKRIIQTSAARRVRSRTSLQFGAVGISQAPNRGVNAAFISSKLSQHKKARAMLGLFQFYRTGVSSSYER